MSTVLLEGSSSDPSLLEQAGIRPLDRAGRELLFLCPELDTAELSAQSYLGNKA